MADFLFTPLARADMPEAMVAAYDKYVARRDGEARLIGAMGHAPALFEWYMEHFYQKLFYGGSVPVVYKELGRLRLSHKHGCRTCNQGNRIDARDAGLPQEKIDHIDDAHHNCFDECDRAVLELADALSLYGAGQKQKIPPPLFDRLRAHFTQAHILELSMTLSMLVGMAHMMFAFDLVEKEDYCEF